MVQNCSNCALKVPRKDHLDWIASPSNLKLIDLKITSTGTSGDGKFDKANCVTRLKQIHRLR